MKNYKNRKYESKIKWAQLSAVDRAYKKWSDSYRFAKGSTTDKNKKNRDNQLFKHYQELQEQRAAQISTK